MEKNNKGLILAMAAIAVIVIGIVITVIMQKSSEKEVNTLQDFHGVYEISNEEYISLNIEGDYSEGYIYASDSSSDSAIKVSLNYEDPNKVILNGSNGTIIGILKYYDGKFEYTDADGVTWQVEKKSDVSMLP